MTMGDLTVRQRTFLEKLKDLYRERKRPIHYSTVAERLGVSKFSAYDMLRVLEKKGVAASEYLLSSKKRGPGRSQVMFYPIAFQAAPDKADGSDEEWIQLKRRLLRELQESYGPDYREKLLDLLTRLPDLRAPMEYCAGTIAALLLNLNLLKEKASERNPLRSVSGLLTGGETGLGTLAGLSLGSVLLGGDEPSLTERLVASVRRYQENLSGLSKENKQRLADFLQEALAVFQKGETQGDLVPSL
jgi:hypothetical protein